MPLSRFADLSLLHNLQFVNICLFLCLATQLTTVVAMHGYWWQHNQINRVLFHVEFVPRIAYLTTSRILQRKFSFFKASFSDSTRAQIVALSY